MNQGPSWIVRIGVILLAMFCGVLLLLAVLFLALGYLVRALGSWTVNASDWFQRRMLIFMGWADRKLYPDSVL